MNKWSLFVNFNQNNFKHKIKQFAIRDENAFLLTDQGQLFGFGKNKDGLLGLNHQNSVYKEPELIYALQEKKVVDVTIGLGFVMVLTDDNQAWIWEEYRKPEKICLIVQSIKCFGRQVMLLTTMGRIYVGEKKKLNYPIENLHNPGYKLFELKQVSSSESFIKVACGSGYFLALTGDHRLFSWGGNLYGQLGIGNTVEQTSPMYVVLKDEESTIKDIACGGNHSMALFDNGNIWCWGSNDSGQLGHSSIQDRSLVPSKISKSLQFRSIACDYGFSAAIAADGSVHVWGKGMRDPVRTPYTNYADAFAFYYAKDVTPRNMLLDNVALCNPVFQRMAISFNDVSSSDLEFIVEDQSIHAHRQYLSLMSPYFERMLREEWKSEDGRRIEISEYSHSAYYFLIRYFYTGYEEVTGLDIAQLIDLLDLSTAVLEESIREACIKGLLSELCIEHACITYRAVDQYDLFDLKPRVVSFIRGYLKQIVQTDAFKQMGLELTKKLMIDFS